MIVLGIETSCDETAVAVVQDTPDIEKRILSHHVLSQLDEHEPYGGVVPEIAARAHLQYLRPLVEKALKDANVALVDIDGIAATSGPGLIGGVMVGVMMAKSLALTQNKPFLAVNHLAAHALTPRLTYDLKFPYLLLLVSGGHCQLVIVKGPTSYELLGSTQDDAVGECFDKCAKMMNLGYPGGPLVEKAALKGDSKRFQLPTPLKGRNTGKDAFAFSFSGLKSAVRREIEKLGGSDSLTGQDRADLCAAMQKAAGASLGDRLKNALNHCQEKGMPLEAVVVAGGVAANQFLRHNLQEITKEYHLPFLAPPPKLCTDNGAMVAWAGVEKLRLNLVDDLDFKPRPRWPLNEME